MEISRIFAVLELCDYPCELALRIDYKELRFVSRGNWINSKHTVNRQKGCYREPCTLMDKKVVYNFLGWVHQLIFLFNILPLKKTHSLIK